jgi:hypothetical protein
MFLQRIDVRERHVLMTCLELLREQLFGEVSQSDPASVATFSRTTDVDERKSSRRRQGKRSFSINSRLD